MQRQNLIAEMPLHLFFRGISLSQYFIFPNTITYSFPLYLYPNKTTCVLTSPREKKM